MLLSSQIKNVERATLNYKAANTLKNHRRLQTKARITRLLSSTKGISAAFGGGMLKGWLGEKEQSSSSGLMMLASKMLLSNWLSVSSVDD